MSGRRMRYLVAVLTVGLALLVAAADASANFVYWANPSSGTIGRAKINGTGLNNAFITGLTNVHAVAIDSQFIYWTQGAASTSSIGRANLDGTGANANFIPTSAGVSFGLLAAPPAGIAVTASGIFWDNNGSSSIGRANLDGGSPNPALVNVGAATPCGIAADQNFVYWLDTNGNRIGRAPAAGGNPDLNFIPGLPTVSPGCGLAVDSSFLYWGAGQSAVGRVPAGGGSLAPNFISSPGASFNTSGVAVQPQYVFWLNNSATPAASTLGRANLNGNSPNQSLVGGLNSPTLPAAAPSNKIAVDSIAKKKKKGTAIVTATVPGPGQVTLNQISTPPDVNATAAAVKEVGLTVTQASSFQLPVKPVGKTAKKLNKQIKKQLRKKHKAKATAKQTVFIHYVPSGVAGVPNDLQVSVTLIKTKSKKK